MSTRPGPRADPPGPRADPPGQRADPPGPQAAADGRLPGAGRLLPREFFARPALAVAGDLLGCVLAHDTSAGLVAVVLTEVEAYEGAADPASHAYRGRTARNAVMFGEPGHAYVYFTYGMHFCVNLVCLPPGTASALLLRAGRVIEGVPLATARRVAGRNGARPGRGAGALAQANAPAGRVAERELARGPARLCQALGIGRQLDGADVCDPGSSLRVLAGLGGPPWPEAPGAEAAVPRVSRGPRIGISAAADRPWRFWLTGDPAVSSYRPYTPRARKVSEPGPPGER
ncbi:MAG TPA: DNA-3-methyladenine glycosylase [Streptosporangiaceae bacterium]|jgi:DNA-3-methyladenine glycosylase|nr:DNA-3-methyladenine glycosylase [Streptosporangiaceae bacterium]